MANEPIITIVGNVGSEPELRFTPSGAAVCNFSVAVTPRRKNGDQWEDGEATWYRVNAWRGLAENIAESIQKGVRVIVQGRLENRKYESREGGTGYSLEITADACGPDLMWAHARVQRPDRQGGNQGGGRPADDPWTNDGGQQRQQGNQGGQYRNQGGGGQYDNRGGGQQRMDQGDPWGSAPQGGRGGYSDEPPF